MAEYIERENAIAWFMPYAHAGESIDADVVISDIKGMKAADVAPVVHGRWLYNSYPTVWYGSGEPPELVCSECEERAYNTYDYCPNCGAKMDGGGE